MRPDPLLGSRIAAVVSAVALGIVLFHGVKAARTSTALYRVWKGELRGDGRTTVATPVVDSLAITTADGTPGVIHFASRSAVLFLYDANCGVCNVNTPRWLDMVAELKATHPDVPVYALPLRPDTVQENRTYWRGLERHVTRAHAADLAELRKLVGVNATPATVVIRNGVRVAAHVGIVGDRRRSFLVERLND